MGSRFTSKAERFTIVHIPGVKNIIPDTFSRYPVSQPTQESTDEDTTALEINFIHSLLAINSTNSQKAITWNKVKLATQSDDDMITLLRTIKEGFLASKQDLPQQLQVYHSLRDDIYCIDGVAFFKDRIIIPQSLRHEILDILHAAHQSVGPMISRSMSSVYWPGITKAIQDCRYRCNDCNRNAPSQPSSPPYPVQAPEYPFQCICADFLNRFLLANYKSKD